MLVRQRTPTTRAGAGYESDVHAESFYWTTAGDERTDESGRQKERECFGVAFAAPDWLVRRSMCNGSLWTIFDADGWLLRRLVFVFGFFIDCGFILIKKNMNEWVNEKNENNLIKKNSATIKKKKTNRIF